MIKPRLIFNILAFTAFAGVSSILISSALDLYNNFAYDRAVLRDSPYGYTPLLSDPKDYSTASREIRSGDYVYVVDWLSAYNSRVVFAKVKSRLSEGYINKDLLVQTNINILPVLSSVILLTILILSLRITYKKFSSA